ncbi:MAG: hypothetical protein DMG39_06735 [Acidobacteria bacterium]|nr:MAG: hypothetical protein DMG39_06735 [Acidobacteriota bacterium]
MIPYDSGEFIGCAYPVRLGTPKYPTIRFRWAPVFRGYTGLHRYGLSSSSPPLADPTRNFPADRGFYSSASIGLVVLFDARYNYGGN